MRFAPKTAEEIAAEQAKFGPWPRGTYDFDIASAEDATSKKRNEMIVLDLVVYDRQGNQRKMKDWLVETVPVKLKHACEAVGLHAAYEGGNVSAHDFVGRSGKLTLTIEKQEGFEERNKVSGYIAGDRPAAPSSGARRPTPRQVASAAPRDLDDEIPF